MTTKEARKYFKHLDLVREDLREELDQLGIHPAGLRICDYGCGSGLTTFGLAIEVKGSQCFGVDLFGEVIGIDPQKIKKLCRFANPKEQPEIVELVKTDRLPKFMPGNILQNENLPQAIELAYCKKVLVNLYGKSYAGTETGESGLLKGLRNIVERMCPQGILCAVEYDEEDWLARYFKDCGLEIERRAHINRREIRSRGRTDVTSRLTLYLCRKAG